MTQVQLTETSADARSAAAFARAREVIPGGVNSPVRAFLSVGGTPRFIARAQGAYLYDLDGNELVDLICSWGPMLLGHAHPEVIGAVTAAALLRQRRLVVARLQRLGIEIVEAPHGSVGPRLIDAYLLIKRRGRL